MKNSGSGREFHYKEAHFHLIPGDVFCKEINSYIIQKRKELDRYILEYPEFQTSLIPLSLTPQERKEMPETALRMHEASIKTGLGPMASVAGIMAQYAAELLWRLQIPKGGTESREKGEGTSLVENGGDLFAISSIPVILGLFTGSNPHFKDLALKIAPEQMPLAVCSSSSRMGHSLSFGDCDLVTVFSTDGALADSAATLGGNLVKSGNDIQPVLNRLISIGGVQGALIIRDDRLGRVGDLPELIRSRYPNMVSKVSGYHL